MFGSHPVPLVLCYELSLSVTDSGGDCSETEEEEGITDGFLGFRSVGATRAGEENLVSCSWCMCRVKHIVVWDGQIVAMILSLT